MPDPLLLRFGREFPAGYVLFREGDPGAEMYVLQSGRVQIRKRLGSGERTVATLGRGEFLGEMALLNGKPRTATAVALEATRCLVLDAATLEQMIVRSPEIAVSLVRKLSLRLDSADEMIQILLTPDPQARVLLGLKRRAETLGEVTAGGVRLTVSATDLAVELGTDAERVRDVLARLRRLRIAEQAEGEPSEVTLLDLARLLEFMEFLETPRKLES
jgi:CRP/FNR family cyclic AMP-dependent transcriptional regulator